jgi:membrane-associated phospholipid phosphatase
VILDRRRLAAVTALVAVALLPRTRVLDAVQRIDDRLLTAVVRHRRPGWRGPARAGTALAEPPAVLLLGAVAGVVALRRGAPLAALLRTSARAGAGIAARRILAEVIRRPRPEPAWWWAEPTGFSYPSRHVTWALLGFCGAADLFIAAGSNRRLPRTLAAAGTALISATRVVLALHWPSDVAAATAAAVAWRTLTDDRRAVP